MARQFRFEVQRSGFSAELYVHDDNTIELVNADSGMPADYLIKKQLLLKEIYSWMRDYNISNLECSEV